MQTVHHFHGSKKSLKPYFTFLILVLMLVKASTLQHNEQGQCSSILNSIPFKNISNNNKTECACPKRTKMYKTKDGQKCLSPQPVEYPEFVDLTCGFLAFLIPAIVALVCKHKEQVDRWRDSKLYTARKEQNKRQGVQDVKQSTILKRENNESVAKIAKSLNFQQTQIHKCEQNQLAKSSIWIKQVAQQNSVLRLPTFASSIDFSSKGQTHNRSTKAPRYATSVDSPRLNYNYGRAKDIYPPLKI